MAEVLSRHSRFGCIPHSLPTARFYAVSIRIISTKPGMSVYSGMVTGTNGFPNALHAASTGDVPRAGAGFGTGRQSWRSCRGDPRPVKRRASLCAARPTSRD
ncbi:TPA: hypothetical protein ACQ7U3_006913, partial [Burkholderia sola]